MPSHFHSAAILVERDPGLVERVGEHERAEHRNIAHGRLLGPALGPVEQLGERRPQTMPNLLHGIDFEGERLGQSLLGEAGIDADAELAGRELQQGEPARCVEMVEHRCEHLRRVEPRCGSQPLHRVRNPDRGVIDLGRLARALGPQQRDGLGHVTDIVAAHVQQNRIDALLGDRANGGMLDRRDVERARQRGEAVTRDRGPASP